MNTSKKFWFVMIGTVLSMAIMACSIGSILPTVTQVPTVPVIPTPTTPAATQTPSEPVHPLPELEGFWQDGSRVFTIEWQTNQYVVTAITSAGTSTRTITDQSWDGSSLTWTYTYADENDNSSITYTTVSVSGDKLTADYSSSTGASSVHILARNSSQTPSYDSLPYYDDFSDSNTGWDVYSTDNDAAGYENGYYYVISKTNQYSSYGAVGNYYGDFVIDVDATPFSGPGENFSLNVGCRLQSNSDGYVFEISADGYFSVGYYSGGGNNYTSLLTGDEWHYSDAIQTGLVMNHITVTCDGNQFGLGVNGQVLFEGQDNTFTSGEVSLGAATYDENNAPAEIHFDNLVVSVP